MLKASLTVTSGGNCSLQDEMDVPISIGLFVLPRLCSTLAGEHIVLQTGDCDG